VLSSPDLLVITESRIYTMNHKRVLLGLFFIIFDIFYMSKRNEYSIIIMYLLNV